MQMDNEKKLAVYTAIISDSLLLNQKENISILFDKTKPIIFGEKIKVPYTANNDGALSAYLYKATDPKFEVKITEKKKIKIGSNTIQINFKKLKLKKGTYVLMLYNNNKSEYVWISEE